jgi:RHS repeat-associated protein
MATTDRIGAVTARYANNPYDKRRSLDGSADAANASKADWSAVVNAGKDQGLTGHEHLDDIGIVHMSGRLFDPRLGRFMQADPVYSDPLDLQAYDTRQRLAGTSQRLSASKH